MVGAKFPETGAFLGLVGLLMPAANSSSALVLSRGGNKTLSMGTRLKMFEKKAVQFILPFYHFPCQNPSYNSFRQSVERQEGEVKIPDFCPRLGNLYLKSKNITRRSCNFVLFVLY
jgi:hypothetical protein